LIRTGKLSSKSGKLEKLRLERKLVDPGDAWIRWRVEISGEDIVNTWEDAETFSRWGKFESSRPSLVDFCMVSGSSGRVARLHPKGIRSSRDQAKLFSSNKNKPTDYTFRGRFVDAEQCASLGYLSSQKIHIALRWLIERQGYRNGEQVIVAWAAGGSFLPKLIAARDELRSVDEIKGSDATAVDNNSLTAALLPERYKGDAGQLFAKQLNKLIGGYRAQLTNREDVFVLGLDSATPGRLAITYYRQLKSSDFLDRVQRWHERAAWPQDMGRDSTSGKYRRFTGAPSPYDIAEAAYGRKVNGRIGVDDKLLKTTIERILPCIIDARPIPRDLVRICVQRACNRLTMNGPDFWEKCLGIACALVRGSGKEEQYTMSLDETRITRDYLYGRLLAIADNIEWLALRVADESRDTNAAQLMQRFADNPFTTWRILELKLRPYMTRLRSSRAGALNIREQLLDNVMGMFRVDVHRVSEFTDNSKLSGEVLLGYHNQRAALIPKKPNKDAVVNEPEGDSTEEEEL
jgi:CRISPR-associated protein Csd1